MRLTNILRRQTRDQAMPDTPQIKGSAVPTIPASYNLSWRLLRPFVGLILRRRAAKGKEDKTRLGERLGVYRHVPAFKQGAIWLHAVSVGETVAALALIEAIAKKRPDAHFLVTTNTVTAAKLVADNAMSATITHLYQPLDHPDCVSRFLAATAPSAAIFMESDFWPNLIARTAASGIPVIFASSQLSDRAFARWQNHHKLATAVFANASMALPVDINQANRLQQLGVAKDGIHVIGSLKVPGALATDATLIAQLEAMRGTRHLLLAASTHEGEDEAVMQAATALGDDWCVLIAPRHPERGPAIARLSATHGLTAKRRGAGQQPEPGDRLYIVDTLGEMGSLFAVADVVFLGGSLRPYGGHNPIEPARFGLPLITGPHIAKNSDEFARLKALGAVRTITDDTERNGGNALADAANASLADRHNHPQLADTIKAYAQEAGKRAANAADYILDLLDTGPARQ
jgi:3-deoxy-D-manno-octulosonic-acid transferase